MGFIKEIAKKILINANLDTKLSFEVLSTRSALRRCLQKGIPLQTVIDVGASDGRWSEEAMQYYPEAFYYLIDAQAQHEAALAGFKRRHQQSNYLISAVGDTEGEIFFDSQDLFGGVASHEAGGEGYARVPVTTIDALVARHNLQGPFLIKLDTHGFEVPILDGAARTLPKANLVIIETYNFKVTADSLLFYEMCLYMKSAVSAALTFPSPCSARKTAPSGRLTCFLFRRPTRRFSRTVMSERRFNKITIVTPCFNAGKYIHETIESVLNQRAVLSGRVGLEFIICDGKSSDNTVAIAQSFNHPAVTIVSEKDQGMYEALAKGLVRATGDICAYLNAGDVYAPAAFDAVLDIFGQKTSNGSRATTPTTTSNCNWCASCCRSATAGSYSGAACIRAPSCPSCSRSPRSGSRALTSTCRCPSWLPSGTRATITCGLPSPNTPNWPSWRRTWAGSGRTKGSFPSNT
jgi:FkbM family methyltransferase